MLPFIGEEELERHKEYQRSEALMLSVEEKKYPKYSSLTIPGLLRMSYRMPEISRLLALRASVKLHDVYFSSFGAGEYRRSRVARDLFGSETAMLSELYRLGERIECGFVGVGMSGSSTLFLFSVGYTSGHKASAISPSTKRSTKQGVYRLEYPAELFSIGDPILAVDLYEHAYFDGYSFDKERYLASALSHLRIDALDNL